MYHAHTFAHARGLCTHVVSVLLHSREDDAEHVSLLTQTRPASGAVWSKKVRWTGA